MASEVEDLSRHLGTLRPVLLKIAAVGSKDLPLVALEFRTLLETIRLVTLQSRVFTAGKPMQALLQVGTPPAAPPACLTPLRCPAPSCVHVCAWMCKCVHVCVHVCACACV